MTDVLTIDRSGAVATLTLNRPDARNALNRALRQALQAAIAEVGADPGVRAVVITGAGHGFCAGADLSEHAEELRARPAGEAIEDVVTHDYNPITLGIAAMPKPVIAAVNGPAAGAGAGFAFACDLRIASSAASFLLAFARVGLGLDSGVSWSLPRLIGSARATALALLAEPVSAEAALAMGMVSAVVEPDQLLATAHELADRFANGPTQAYAAIKAAIAYAASTTLADALVGEADWQRQLIETVDHRSATAAFAAKAPSASVTFIGR